jgi:hypothetical protein
MEAVCHPDLSVGEIELHNVPSQQQQQDNPLLHIYTCIATSVDPDQPAYPCCLIRICTVRFLVRNNLINQKVNSADPDHIYIFMP